MSEGCDLAIYRWHFWVACFVKIVVWHDKELDANGVRTRFSWRFLPSDISNRNQLLFSPFNENALFFPGEKTNFSYSCNWIRNVSVIFTSSLLVSENIGYILDRVLTKGYGKISLEYLIDSVSFYRDLHWKQK